MRITDSIIGRAVVAAALAAAAVPWLVAADADTGRWLIVTLVAGPVAALLNLLAGRLVPAPARIEAAALVALAAAAGAALGGLTAGLLDGSSALGATGAAGRDLLLALAVSAPLGLAVVRCASSSVAVESGSGAPAPARPRGPAGGTSRRTFLQIGAAGGVAVAGLSRVVPAGAQAPVPFLLTITDGDITMVDGTPVFFRGFRATNATADVPQIPGPPIGNTGPGVKGRDIFEGEPVRVVVANSTARDHTFLIEQTANEKPTNPVVGPVVIPAHGSRTIDFTAPPAGSYVYRDADRNNRLLGMAGAFIVEPAGVGGRLLPFAPSNNFIEITTELRSQITWVLTDVDPVLGELARTQAKAETIAYPLSKILPRYFLINGQTGVDATRNVELTIPVVPLLDPTKPFNGDLIRCINTGVAAHSLHWHGNHVFPVELNGIPEKAGVVLERDVQEVRPLQTVDVILPAHTGFDAFPPLSQNPKKEQHYPMHCHAEMSQTAAGGSYPFGLLTDWHLAPDVATAQAITQRLAQEARDGRKKVPEAQVQAAIDDVRKNTSGPGGGKGSSGSSGSSGGPGKD